MGRIGEKFDTVFDNDDKAYFDQVANLVFDTMKERFSHAIALPEKGAAKG